MTFALTPKQIEANRLLASDATNIMLRGGSRSGKTFLLVRALCIRAMKASNSHHAIWRFRSVHARSSVWKTTIPQVMRRCFPDVPYQRHDTDMTATFPNGSQIIVGGLDDAERVERILGQEYSTNYYNEASQIPWSSVETSMSRLAENSGLALKAYFDCNPPSKLHWSHQLFKEKLKPGTREALANPDDYVEMLVNPSDNRANLPAKYFDVLAGMSEAKRKRFERGEWSSEVNGALWTLEDRIGEDGSVIPGIDTARVKINPDDPLRPIVNGVAMEMRRIVVAVDPSGTKGKDAGEKAQGDDIGISVAGLGVDGRGYVFGDLTCQLSPEGWGRRVADAYHRFRADRVIGEKNFGGDMVRFVVQTADKGIPYKDVNASRGKVVRAEPISALYEQGKVSHVGAFPDLEDQLCAMTMNGYVGEGSPDRADALVWALTELMMGGSTYNIGGWE